MLKNMEYVYTVYLEKSFSKAAKKLFVSQPALSAIIKKVEIEIQISIFDRSCNPIQLTQAGEYYIKSIEKIMEIQKDMEEYFSAINKDKKGAITIGSATYFCAHILPSIIQEFKEIYPNYRVNLLETNSKESVTCLQSGVIDLSIGVEKLDTNIYESIIWQQESILLAVPSFYEVNRSLKQYALNFEDIYSKRYLNNQCLSVSLTCFKDEPFIFLRKGNDLYKRGLRMCKNSGFEPNIEICLDQLLTSYYVAYSGKGTAFVRADITNHVEPSDKLLFYKIDDVLSERDILLHYKKSNSLTKITKDFIDFLNIKTS